MGTRLIVIAALAALPAVTTGCGAPVRRNVVYETDFSRPDPKSWTFHTGKWKFVGGALEQKDPSGYARRVAVLNRSVGDCIIEADGAVTATNAGGHGTIGIIGKAIDPKKFDYLGFRYGAYGYMSGTGRLDALFGGAWPQVGVTHRVKLIFVNNMVGVVVDGTLRGVRKDPFAGKKGKPGLYTESGVRYTRFKVTELKTARDR